MTNNEMLLIATILKSPEVPYNANTLANILEISPMGAWKIAQKLQKEDILHADKIGNAHILKLNLANEYARNYMRFVLAREIEIAPPYVKRWITELKKIKHAELIILFGSVLRKHEDARDIDALIVTDNKQFKMLKKEIEDINFLNDKKVHPIYQTKEDLRKNIAKRDKIVLNAIKGLMVSGQDAFIEVLTT
ncbi:MAG: nucleotidyltransferase domain-containing protein [Nanoarchaeota archaeon]